MVINDTLTQQIEQIQWVNQHAAFCKAIMQADTPVPRDVVRFDGKVSQKRFNIYRNNVVTSLIEALREGFPMINRLVGDTCFSALATLYVHNNIPKTPCLYTYGDDFAQCIAQCDPLAPYPYLADIAKLEYLQRMSLYAKNTNVHLNKRNTLAQSQKWLFEPLPFAPSTQLLSSQYPIYDFWQAHYQNSNASITDANITFVPQDVVIIRKDFHVQTHLLPVGGMHFFMALAKGQSPHQACVIADQKTTQETSTQTLQNRTTQLLTLALAASSL